MTRGKRVVVSVAGAAGSGKSQLALAVVQVLGDEDAARVPMDYFIEPRIVPMELWMTQPLAYDRKRSMRSCERLMVLFASPRRSTSRPLRGRTHRASARGFPFAR